MPSDFWMSLSGKTKVLMGSSVVRDTVLTPPSEVVASWHYSGQILRFAFQSPIPVVSLTARAHARGPIHASHIIAHVHCTHRGSSGH
jgi:hypothetical protein